MPSVSLDSCMAQRWPAHQAGAQRKSALETKSLSSAQTREIYSASVERGCTGVRYIFFFLSIRVSSINNTLQPGPCALASSGGPTLQRSRKRNGAPANNREDADLGMESIGPIGEPGMGRSSPFTCRLHLPALRTNQLPSSVAKTLTCTAKSVVSKCFAVMNSSLVIASRISFRPHSGDNSDGLCCEDIIARAVRQLDAVCMSSDNG